MFPIADRPVFKIAEKKGVNETFHCRQKAFYIGYFIADRRRLRLMKGLVSLIECPFNTLLFVSHFIEYIVGGRGVSD